MTQTALEQINANKEFRAIVDFLNEVTYFHLVPQLIRNPQAFTGPGIQDDPFGKSFLTKIAGAPSKKTKANLKKIEDALKIVIPQLTELKDVKDENGIPHLEAIYQHWRPNGARQREDQFSDGTLRLIALLWSFLEGQSLLLLEEPELSLHRGIVSQIPAMLYNFQKKKKKKRQVIISTHSYELLSDPGIGGEETLLLTPDKERTEISSASDDKDILALLEGGLSIAESVGNKLHVEKIERLGRL